jgi:hypothetical protein
MIRVRYGQSRDADARRFCLATYQRLENGEVLLRIARPHAAIYLCCDEIAPGVAMFSNR